MKLNILFAAMVLAGVSVATTAGAQQCLTRPATVGFLPKMDTDPYFHVARDGAMEAQKEIGGKVIQQGPSTATADAQIEFINSLVAQKIDVLAIAGTDANALAPALKRAAGQGVRVISYDSDVAKSARAVYVNQVKSDSLANQMLESMGAMIDYTGEFAILSSTPTATNQNAWVDLMKRSIAQLAPVFSMQRAVIEYAERYYLPASRARADR